MLEQAGVPQAEAVCEAAKKLMGNRQVAQR